MIAPDQIATLGGVLQCPSCGQQNTFAAAAHPAAPPPAPPRPPKSRADLSALLVLGCLIAIAVLAVRAPWAAIAAGTLAIGFGIVNIHGKRRLSVSGWMITRKRPNRSYGVLDILAGCATIGLSIGLMVLEARREEADRIAGAAAHAKAKERAEKERAEKEALLATAPKMESHLFSAIASAEEKLAANELKTAEDSLKQALEAAKSVATHPEAPASLVEQYNAGSTLLAKVRKTAKAVGEAEAALEILEQARNAEKSKDWIAADEKYAKVIATQEAVEGFEKFLPPDFSSAVETATERRDRISQDAEKAREKREEERAAAARRLASKWDYQSFENEMGGTTTMAAIESDNTVSFDFPYRGVQHGRLALRRSSKGALDVMLSIEKGQFTCGFRSCRVEVRFDDKPAKKYRAVEPSDYSATMLFIRNERGFLKELKKAETVRIAATFYQEGQRVFEFDVDGFDPKAL